MEKSVPDSYELSPVYELETGFCFGSFGSYLNHILGGGIFLEYKRRQIKGNELYGFLHYWHYCLCWFSNTITLLTKAFGVCSLV